MIIRSEERQDFAAIWRVNRAAFGRADEANMVEALRKNQKAVISLVACLGSEVAGHILFSPVEISRASESLNALGLAPVAVLPENQRSGIGSALINAGLDRCRRELGIDAVVVLGHHNYYPRFGFVPASRFGLKSEYNVPDEVFMALELRDGALDGASGIVRYAREFSQV